MPSRKEHCQDSLERYGKRFDELHKWMDEPSTMLARYHRIHRHDPVGTPPIAKRLFGELADQACIDHIRLDKLGEKRLKREKSKKPKLPKKSYWKNHEFHRPKMGEIVTEYCGDKFLEDLVEKCGAEYRSNQDYLRRRDKALVAALFLTGGRVREVLSLKKNNFDFDNEEAKRDNAFLVRNMIVLKRSTGGGKRKRVTRTFPIWRNDPLVKHLLAWLREIDGYLFLSKEKKIRPMGRTRAHQIVSILGESLDIPVHHINPQWFRVQREHYLIKEKGFSTYDVQVYIKLSRPLLIARHRKDWQNLLAVARPPKKEKIYDKTPYDAYKDINSIIISARKEVNIIDPFVDDSIFELYLDGIHPNAKVKLITKNMYRKFREVAKRFKIQNPNFEVRISNEAHDRYLIIDGKVWVIGQSLKDAGMKPLYIVELVDKDRVLVLFQKLWNRAKKELS